jgi:hypothetical protein
VLDFGGLLARGKVARRYRSIDDMLQALHQCLQAHTIDTGHINKTHYDMVWRGLSYVLQPRSDGGRILGSQAAAYFEARDIFAGAFYL